MSHWPAPTLEELLQMPWGVRGPQRCADNSGEWYEIRVEELPEFFVADTTREKVLDEYVPALTAFLASYTEHGETPPVSPAVLWGWLAAARRPGMRTGSTSVDVLTRGEG